MRSMPVHSPRFLRALWLGLHCSNSSATAANFGIAGNGRLYLFSSARECYYETQDAVFDCAWSECNERQIVCAGGDGGVRLFDTSIDVYLLL